MNKKQFHLNSNDHEISCDDVNDDVLGAINAGARGILVQTGKYRKGDEEKVPEERRNVANTFVEAVDLIQQNNVK